jgi:thymidylate synthase (FAD)
MSDAAPAADEMQMARADGAWPAEADLAAVVVPAAGSAPMVDAVAPLADRAVAVGPLGSVLLVDAMPRLVRLDGIGPEAAIVQAARVSYGAGTRTAHDDAALLRYLFRHSHLTPFEMVVLKWRVRAPLFTARQWMRHRAGAFNEESARYSVIATEFYEPEPASVRAQSRANRQGGGETLGDEATEAFLAGTRTAYGSASATYEAALAAGVARELARVTLPEGRYTTFYWTVNLRNLFGFLELRLDAAAQENIRQYAGAVFGLLEKYCPLACRAFRDYRLEGLSLSALEVRAARTGVPPSEMSARERGEWEKKKKVLNLF